MVASPLLSHKQTSSRDVPRSGKCQCQTLPRLSPFEWRSGVDQIDRTKKIHLADIDAIMAEDGVGHRDVEKSIGYRHLQQVVLAADYLAGRPGQFDFAFSRIRVL